MEQLTEWSGNGHAAVVNHHENYIDRLAAYEDTGLEPEQIVRARDTLECFDNIGIKRGNEIVKAEQEGRLVVLPCKVGDHLFAVTRNIVSEFAVSHFEMHSDLMWASWDIVDGIFGHFRIDGIPTDIIGKTVFLTRAEAEKAMEVSEDA